MNSKRIKPISDIRLMLASSLVRRSPIFGSRNIRAVRYASSRDCLMAFTKIAKVVAVTVARPMFVSSQLRACTVTFFD